MSSRTDSPCAVRDNHRGCTISKVLTRSDADNQGIRLTSPSSDERYIATCELSLCLKDLHTFMTRIKHWLLESEATLRILSKQPCGPDNYRCGKRGTAVEREVNSRCRALFWGVKVLTGNFLPTEIFNIIEKEIKRLFDRETEQLIRGELGRERAREDGLLMNIRLRRFGYIMQW